MDRSCSEKLLWFQAIMAASHRISWLVIR